MIKMTLLLATLSMETVRDRVKLTACICTHPTWFSLRTRANKQQHHTTAVKSATCTITSLKLQGLDATSWILQASNVAVMSSRTLRHWALRTTKHGSRSCTMASPGQTNLAVSFTSDSNLSSMERIGANDHQMREFDVSLLIFTSI